ncbi:MAG TPA: hypothetical protein VLB80_03840 [Candidatus Babeliales bacterium]|nr:hypothetical protein [Candidatus Babeliales bacterium]
MNHMRSFLCLFFIIVLTATTCLISKRPRREKPPKPPKNELTQEQKQVIVSNIAQVMGGVCTIVQDPHNPHNIGNSVASMIHGLINIAVEKISNRKIDMNDVQAVQECINELCEEISAEITKIIIMKNINKDFA